VVTVPPAFICKTKQRNIGLSVLLDSNGNSRTKSTDGCISVAVGSAWPCRLLEILASRNERGSHLCLIQQKEESIPGLKQNGL
jgi:hypothetical protein